MGYASKSGRAITNPQSPRAFGVCDRCGIWYNLHRLKYQWEWQGVSLVNLKFRVCPTCMDIPNPQLKARMAPPDPVPINDPRPESFSASRWTPTGGPGSYLARTRDTPSLVIDTEAGPPLEIE